MEITVDLSRSLTEGKIEQILGKVASVFNWESDRLAPLPSSIGIYNERFCVGEKPMNPIYRLMGHKVSPKSYIGISLLAPGISTSHYKIILKEHGMPEENLQRFSDAFQVFLRVHLRSLSYAEPVSLTEKRGS